MRSIKTAPSVDSFWNLHKRKQRIKQPCPPSYSSLTHWKIHLLRLLFIPLGILLTSTVILMSVYLLILEVSPEMDHLQESFPRLPWLSQGPLFYALTETSTYCHFDIDNDVFGWPFDSMFPCSNASPTGAEAVPVHFSIAASDARQNPVRPLVRKYVMDLLLFLFSG